MRRLQDIRATRDGAAVEASLAALAAAARSGAAKTASAKWRKIATVTRSHAVPGHRARKISSARSHASADRRHQPWV